MFAQRGASVVNCPLLATLATENDSVSQPQSLNGLSAFFDAILDRQFGLIIFYTGQGVTALMEAAERRGRGEAVRQALAATQRLARGAKTRAALRRLDLDPQWMAEPPTTEGILRLLASGGPLGALEGMRIAVILSGDHLPPELTEAVRRRYAHLFACVPYVHRLPEDLAAVRPALTAIANREVQAAVFTTPPQVRLLLEAGERLRMGEALRSGLQQTVLAAVGTVTEAELRRQGFQPQVVAPPRQETMAGVVKALESHFAQ